MTKLLSFVFPTAGKANLRLEFRFLVLYKWIDESGNQQKLRIIDSISGNWQEVAALLGLSMSQMKGIQQQSFNVPERCCCHVFDCWINSNGGDSTDYDITFSGLHQLLLDAKMCALAEQLRKAVGLEVKSDRVTEKASLGGTASRVCMYVCVYDLELYTSYV